MASYYRRCNKSIFLDFLFTFHPCLCYYKYAAIHEHMTTDFMFMFYSWNWNNSNQISIWLFNLSCLYSDHIDIQLVRVAIQKSTGKKLHLKYGLNAKEMHLRSFFFSIIELPLHYYSFIPTFSEILYELIYVSTKAF